MTERSIDELLAGLTGPVRPDPSFEAGLAPTSPRNYAAGPASPRPDSTTHPWSRR